MPITAVKGKFGIFKWAGTSLPAVEWTLPITANVDDTSNFRDGRQRTPTLEDASGVTFTLINENDDSTTLGTTLAAGAYGTAQFYTNNASTKFYQMVLCVTDVSLANGGVNSTQRYSVTAGLHGTIQYPL